MRIDNIVCRSLLLVFLVSFYHAGVQASTPGKRADTPVMFEGVVRAQGGFDYKQVNRLIADVMHANLTTDLGALQRLFHQDVVVIQSIGDNRQLKRRSYDKRRYMAWLRRHWREQAQRRFDYRVSSISPDGQGGSIVTVMVNERFTVGRKSQSLRSTQRYRIRADKDGNAVIGHLVSLSVNARS